MKNKIIGVLLFIIFDVDFERVCVYVYVCVFGCFKLYELSTLSHKSSVKNFCGFSITSFLVSSVALNSGKSSNK